MTAPDPRIQLGPYRISGPVGRGAMGVVHRGVHVETGAEVAIKTATGDEKIAVLRREIDALRRVRHPDIVHLIDEGVTGGRPWVAMPLLGGKTLREHLDARRARLSIPPAALAETDPIADRIEEPPRAGTAGAELLALLTVIRRLCAPLAFLHGEGLVHRDLKPENIVVQENGRPALLDLGIAVHFAGSEGREELELDGVAGTPWYMAPEQIRGELCDGRADLYALGCILYECVTGRPPFWGANRAVYHQHLNERPISPVILAPGIPVELDRLILRLLEKRPRDRIGYATDVAAALVALGASAAYDEGPAPRPYLYRAEIMGRADAMAALMASVDRVLSQRRGGLALVSGESGVGKTRLLREIAQLAARHVPTVITGACVAPGAGEAGATAAVAGPLEPLLPLLAAAADRARASRVIDRALDEHAPVLAAYLPSLRDLPGKAELPAPPALPPEAARERVIASLSAVLRSMADVCPVLLLVDDVQWADDLTLSFLQAIAREDHEESGVLVVATYRSEEARAEIRALSSAASVAKVPLARLAAPSVGAMVEGMLGGNAPPRAVIDVLARHANGNPFFVAAYLRAAIDEGILRRDERGSFCFRPRGAAALSSLSLPHTLAALLSRRLDGLGADERALVDWAAVVGQAIDEDILLAGPLDALATVRALDELRARQILEETAGGDLRFSHDKIREIAYARIPEAERALLHLAAGEALEDRGPAAGLAPSLGHHFSRAGLHDRAGQYFIIAAERAREVYANDAAVRHFRAALDALSRAGAAPAEIASLGEDLGDVLALVGRHEEARGAYEAALARTRPDEVLASARLSRKVGKTWEAHHQHDEALALYARAEAALGPEPAGPSADGGEGWWREWIQIQHDRISVHYWLADVERLSLLVDALRPVVERRGVMFERGRYFHALTQRNLQVERFVASEETVRGARASVEAFLAAGMSPDDYWGLVARASLAIVLVLHGDLEGAEAPMTDVLHTARRTGDVEAQARCLTYLSVIHRRLGRVGPARGVAEQARSLARERELLEYVGAAEANLGWAALRSGDIEEAEAAAEAAIDCWRDQPRHVYPFQWLARLPLLAARLQRGRVGDAAREARAILDERQQRLPRRVSIALAAAVQASRAADEARAKRALAISIRAARRAGYL